ncbi:hypothetical protein [Ohtaekwangia koreensis]|uniref:hypothetical protein n=1 Tax=Ohtaekwangia koreensis TaxID=688867 RepID=UPI00117D060C|nr:hypothetical protein [Ohtaekwangia koreensis]
MAVSIFTITVHGCPERFRAEETNANFLNFLKEYTPQPETAEVTYEELSQKIKADRNIIITELQEIEAESIKNRKRVENAQYLMLDGELASGEYKEIKHKCPQTNEALLRRKANLASAEDDYRGYLEFAKTLLVNLDKCYRENEDLKAKQLIIGSVFPEKLVYEKNQFRTKRANEVMSYFS